jgi:hypothetical protein
MSRHLKRILIGAGISWGIVLTINSTVRIVTLPEQSDFRDRLITCLLTPSARVVEGVHSKNFPIPIHMSGVEDYLAMLSLSMIFYTVLIWILLSLCSWVKDIIGKKRTSPTQT